MKKTAIAVALGVLLCLGANLSLAQVPHSFSYQGYLTDAAKSPVTGIHQLIVKIYDSPVEGSILHTENFNPSVEKGIFSVIIGSGTPLESAVSFDRQYWIGISIDGGAELSPRTALVSVPYAVRAEEAAALAKGAKGAVTSINGKEGVLNFKGGPGTTIQTEGNNIVITAGAGIGNPTTQVTTVSSITGTANQILANATSGVAQANAVTLTLPQNIGVGNSPTFAGMTLSGLGTGIAHSTAGVLSSSLIVNADISSTAAIADSKLGTISSSGKVANSATTATSSNTPNTIVARDGSGNFQTNAITVAEIDMNGSSTVNGNWTESGNIEIDGNLVEAGVSKLHLGPQKGYLLTEDVSSYGFGNTPKNANGQPNVAPVGWAGTASGNSGPYWNGTCIVTDICGNATGITGPNSMINLLYGSGISGDASVSLGGTLHLNNTGVLSVSGSGAISSTGGQNPIISISTGLLKTPNGTLTIGGTGKTVAADINADLNLANTNTWTGVQTFPAGSITNGELANASLNVNTGSGLSGGGNVALGGSLTLDANIQHDGTLTGIGTTASPLAVNVGNVLSNLTASNGVHKTAGNDIELGGALTMNTDIPLSGHNMTFSVTDQNNNTGRIGVGVTNPSTIFSNTADGPTINAQDQNGDGLTNASINWQKNDGGYVAGFWNHNTTAGNPHGVIVKTTSITHNTRAFDVNVGSTSGGSPIGDWGKDIFTVTGDSRVGINNNSPAQALDVNGIVRVEQFAGNTDDNLVTANGSGDLSVRTIESLGGLISVATDGTTITGDGTTGNPITLNTGNTNNWTATQTFPNHSITNDELANASINLSYSAGLSGDASVALGGTLNLDLDVQHDGSLSGNGDETQLTLNLNNANIWTATQTFPNHSITNDELVNGSITINSGGLGLSGTGTVALGGTLTLDLDVQHDGSLTGDGDANPLAINTAHSNAWTALQSISGAGNFQYTGNGEQPGYVLTCDANGVASWQPVTAAATQATGAEIDSYIEVTVGAQDPVAIPSGYTVVVLKDHTVNGSYSYTLPPGTNGQILYIHNDSGDTAQNTVLNVGNGSVSLLIYCHNMWMKVTN